MATTGDQAHDKRAGGGAETVAVVIPTLNEERSIGKVIDDVPVADLLKNGLKTAVYVIDGRSTDNTREIAIEKGAQIMLCLLYTSPSPRDGLLSRMPSSA